MAHQLAFIVEPIKDWKINVELNYRSNYNFNHTDYQTVYGYDVSKIPTLLPIKLPALQNMLIRAISSIRTSLPNTANH